MMPAGARARRAQAVRELGAALYGEGWARAVLADLPLPGPLAAVVDACSDAHVTWGRLCAIHDRPGDIAPERDAPPCDGLGLDSEEVLQTLVAGLDERQLVACGLGFGSVEHELETLGEAGGRRARLAAAVRARDGDTHGWPALLWACTESLSAAGPPVLPPAACDTSLSCARLEARPALRETLTEAKRARADLRYSMIMDVCEAELGIPASGVYEAVLRHSLMGSLSSAEAVFAPPPTPPLAPPEFRAGCALHGGRWVRGVVASWTPSPLPVAPESGLIRFEEQPMTHAVIFADGSGGVAVERLGGGDATRELRAAMRRLLPLPPPGGSRRAVQEYATRDARRQGFTVITASRARALARRLPAGPEASWTIAVVEVRTGVVLEHAFVAEDPAARAACVLGAPDPDSPHADDILDACADLARARGLHACAPQGYPGERFGRFVIL